MKKHLSVISLASRGVVYKLIIIIALTAAAQVIMFLRSLDTYILSEPSFGAFSFADVIFRAKLPLICGAGFVLLCAACCFAGCELKGSRISYTYQRLRISESAVLAWQSGVNAMCFIIYWASQAAIAALLWVIWSKSGHAHGLIAQSALVFTYNNDYLHSLIPIEDYMRLARNIILCLGLGFCSAAFSFRQRRGKRAWGIFILAIITLFSFVQNMAEGTADAAMIGFTLLDCGIVLFGVSSAMTEEYEDEE